VADTLAYYNIARVTAVKSFVVQEFGVEKHSFSMQKNVLQLFHSHFLSHNQVNQGALGIKHFTAPTSFNSVVS
jgi:hypothetical protein